MTLSPRTMGPREPAPRRVGLMLSGCTALALSACTGSGFDPDFRGYSALGFDTAGAARNATERRPEPDGRGVISYPTYQVAVAQSGDTVASVAQRVGVTPGELASYNAIDINAPLNRGAVLALPTRVAGNTGMSSPIASGTIGGGAMGGAASEQIDVTTLASNAIDRAAPQGTATAAAPVQTAAAARPTAEPVRHKVARGETAYSIARYYNVPVKSLAEWNGLSSDMSVHEGQYLLIPVAAAGAAAAGTPQPGQGSATPEPPSASKPLPSENPAKSTAPVDRSAAPDLGAGRTAASRTSQLQMPVSGSIIRSYVKGKNDGIDIGAPAGTAVKAAEAGTVAAITKDTEQVPILVLRHSDGLLTVYANIDQIAVAKGDTVKRGQNIAKVRAGSESFMHFEVRKGYDSVDPVPYLE